MHHKKINLDDFFTCHGCKPGRTFFRVARGYLTQGGVFHLQKISENFYWEFWEFPFGKRAFHLSQVPFVCKPLWANSQC